MQDPHLIYFADPMCSWCWGFSPVVQQVSECYGTKLPIRLVLGGLRPWTQDALKAEDRAEIRRHWEHVQHASGQAFDFGFFHREHFVYDTEPSSRAIVVVRRRGMSAALRALQRIQKAFYAENQDVTQVDTLSVLVEQLGIPGLNEARFKEEFSSTEAQEETRADFVLAQSAGIRGFPTLIVGMGGDLSYELVTHGFQPAAQVLPVIDAWINRKENTGGSTEAGHACSIN